MNGYFVQKFLRYSFSLGLYCIYFDCGTDKVPCKLSERTPIEVTCYVLCLRLSDLGRERLMAMGVQRLTAESGTEHGVLVALVGTGGNRLSTRGKLLVSSHSDIFRTKEKKIQHKSTLLPYCNTELSDQSYASH